MSADMVNSCTIPESTVCTHEGVADITSKLSSGDGVFVQMGNTIERTLIVVNATVGSESGSKTMDNDTHLIGQHVVTIILTLCWGCC